MKTKALVWISIVMAACASPAAAVAGFSECEEAKADPHPNALYIDLVCDAEREVAEGNLADARISALGALQVQFHEAPNYIPVILLAEIECRAGATATGMSLVRDFECMLAVEVGDRQCHSGDDPFGHGPIPNDVTSFCFLQMCGEIYRSYYLNPTDRTMAFVDRLRQEAARVRELCG